MESQSNEEDWGKRLAKALLGPDYKEGELPPELSEATISQILGIDDLESDLSLPKGFFDALVKDDDWSFVIKLHALLEAAMTHLLVNHFGEPALDEVFSSLEMSNLRTGKLAFAASTGLIDSDIKRFVQKLSELRNELVHDVTNVSTHLSEFFGGLTESELKGYRKGFTLGFQRDNKVNLRKGPNEYSTKELFRLMSGIIFDKLPRIAIWTGAAHCLSHIYSRAAFSKVRHQKQVVEAEILRRLLDLDTEWEAKRGA